MRKAVYLPLGKLSFADKVVKVNHPLLMTQQVNNVIGEPDVIKGFLAEDISGIHSLGLGGSLTIQFIDNALTNVNGPDLYIFEIGQIEPTDLEISKDGKKWIKVGKIDGGVAEVDIAPFVKQGELFYYIRLKDLKKKSALPGADVDAIAAIGAAMRLNLDSKVLFDSGKSILKPAGKEALKELARSIQVLKRGNVIVEGHTDDVGSEETNRKLSLARAKSVSTELKKLIPNKNFKWREKGLGESKPLVENNSDINKAKNRRVEILVLPN
jgi:outer membrane protein OmpA-like peptidoglycan-associated protein